MKIPVIRSSRLILRSFTHDDSITLHQILNEKDIRCYFPNSIPLSFERVETMIIEQSTHWAEYEYGWWAVEELRDNKLIGWCGLQYLHETKETEISFLLSQESWGKGFATEGGRASLDYGFDKLGIKNIVGITHPKNIASQRVLQKSGMVFVSEARYFGMDCYRYTIDHIGYKNCY